MFSYNIITKLYSRRNKKEKERKCKIMNVDEVCEKVS